MKAKAWVAGAAQGSSGFNLSIFAAVWDVDRTVYLLLFAISLA